MQATRYEVAGYWATGENLWQCTRREDIIRREVFFIRRENIFKEGLSYWINWPPQWMIVLLPIPQAGAQGGYELPPVTPSGPAFLKQDWIERWNDLWNAARCKKLIYLKREFGWRSRPGVKDGAPKLTSKNYATKPGAPTKQVPSQCKTARPTDMPKCRMHKAENEIDLLF